MDKKSITGQKLVNGIFYAALALFLIKLNMDEAVTAIPWPSFVHWGSRALILYAMFLKVGYDKPYRSIEWLVTVLLFLIFGLYWTQRGSLWLVDIPLIMLGTPRLSYRKLCKLTFYAQLYSLIIAILFSMSGYQDDLDPAYIVTRVVMLVAIIYVLYVPFRIWQTAICAAVGALSIGLLVRYKGAGCLIEGAYQETLKNHNLFLLLVVIGMYFYYGYKLYCHKQWKLLSVLIVIVCMSFFGDCLLNPGANFLIPILTCSYPKEEERVSYTPELYTRMAVGCTLLLLFCIRMRRTALYMRTYFHMNGNEHSLGGTLFFCIGIVFLFFFGWILMKVSYRIYRMRKKKRFRPDYIGAFGVGAVGFLVLCLVALQITSKVPEEMERSFDMEQEIVEQIVQRKTADHFCVQDLPILYEKYFNGVHAAYFRQKTLKDTEHCVLVATKEEELQDLLDAGYLFTEISENHAIYTNCEETKAVLEEYGYIMSSYSTARFSMNLGEAVLRNSLEWTKEGGILLAGSEKSLWSCPISNARGYSGKFRIQIETKLLTEELPPDAEIASFFITKNEGKDILYANTIYAQNLSEIDTLVADVLLTGNMEEINLLLVARDGISMEIRDISWQRLQ